MPTPTWQQLVTKHKGDLSAASIAYRKYVSTKKHASRKVLVNTSHGLSIFKRQGRYRGPPAEEYFMAGNKDGEWWALNETQANAFRRHVSNVDGYKPNHGEIAYSFIYVGTGQGDSRYAIRTSDGKFREIIDRSLPRHRSRSNGSQNYIGL